MSLVVRKQVFCKCENKDADQFCGTAKLIMQRLCFSYLDNTILLLSKSEIDSTIPLLSLAIFCGCAAQFVSDQVGNPKDQFSHNEAQIVKLDKTQAYSKVCILNDII